MSKKPKPENTGTKPESDQSAYEKLPEETKELMKLKEQQTKTIGSEQVVVTRKIEDTEDEPEP